MSVPLSTAAKDEFEPAKAPLEMVLLLGALTAFAALSIDMYLPSLPSMARDFHVSTDAAQATLAWFLAGLALGQLFYGPASDRWGAADRSCSARRSMWRGPSAVRSRPRSPR